MNDIQVCCEGECLLSVAVSCIRHLRRARKIVQPVQTRLLGDGIDAAEQQVDRVRMFRAQRAGELAADERRQRGRAQLGLVAHAVEGDVGLDEFGELHGVACFAGEGHQVVLVEHAGLVVVGFEDGGAAHCGFGRGDDGEVAAGEAEEDFPGVVV